MLSIHYPKQWDNSGLEWQQDRVLVPRPHSPGTSLRPHHVLLGDVALHVAVGVLVLEELAEGGVLGVPVQRHHVVVVAAQLGQSHAVGLPGGHLHAREGERAD